MAGINIETARQKAKERIVSALRQFYAAELTSIKDPSTLPLPAPDDKAYYTIARSPDELAIMHDVAVVIRVDGNRSLTDPSRSSGMDRFAQQGLTDFRIDVVFRMRLPDPAVVIPDAVAGSRTLELDEVMERRAEQYLGALIGLVYKKFCDPDSIHKAWVVADLPSLLYDGEEPVLGIATAIVRVEQKLLIPLHVE